MQATASRPPISLIIVLVAMYLVVRAWILFTAMPSFSTGDTDKWHDWAMEANYDRSPLAGAATRIVDYSFGECCGGHRFCLALCILSGAVVPPSYLAVKAWALLWGVLTLVAFFWALRSVMATTTAVLFALLFTFAPIRFLTQSHTFMGNHVESILFIVTSLGFAVRAHEAARDRRLKTRDAMIVGLAFTLGLAIYFLQSMWLWLGCVVFTLAIFGVTTQRWLDRGRVLVWFLAGLLPGAFLIYTVYWPDHMVTLIPYNFQPVYWEGNDFARVFNVGAIAGLWSTAFGSVTGGLASQIASSPIWFVAGLFLLVKGRLRMALIPLIAFSALMLAAARISGTYGSRHLVAIIPAGLLMQSLLLTGAMPWLGAKVAPESSRARTRGLLTFFGLVVGGGVLLYPRIEDVAKVAERHPLEEAGKYDPRVLSDLGIDGMEVQYIAGAADVIRKIEGLTQELALSRNERACLLEGARVILGAGEHFNLECSLPESMVSDVSPAAMVERGNDTAHIALSRLEEQFPDDAPEEQEELFICGFELAEGVINPAGDVFPDMLVAMP